MNKFNKLTDDEKKAVLVKAIQANRPNEVRFLLKQKEIDVNQDNGYPLSVAVNQGNKEIIQILLECEDIDMRIAPTIALYGLNDRYPHPITNKIINMILDHKNTVVLRKLLEESWKFSNNMFIKFSQKAMLVDIILTSFKMFDFYNTSEIDEKHISLIMRATRSKDFKINEKYIEKEYKSIHKQAKAISALALKKNKTNNEKNVLIGMMTMCGISDFKHIDETIKNVYTRIHSYSMKHMIDLRASMHIDEKETEFNSTDFNEYFSMDIHKRMFQIPVRKSMLKQFLLLIKIRQQLELARKKELILPKVQNIDTVGNLITKFLFKT